MKRMALIIGAAGGDGGGKFLPGVARDLEKYSRFFKTPLGGAWEDNEVVVLDNPTVQHTSSEIKRLRSVDYSIVIFSGHGGHSSRTRSTHISLRGGVDFDSDELRVGADKHVVVLDCCRVVEPSVTLEAAMDSMMKSAPKLSRSECRKYYEQRVIECVKGIMVLHACAIDETAGDSPRDGGYYSSSLLDFADDWLRASNVDTSQKYKICSWVQAHEGAVRDVARRSGKHQNPMMEAPRVNKHFPFAVIA